jgi:hypothetical protein
MLVCSFYYPTVMTPLFAASSLPIVSLQVVIAVVVIYALASKYAKSSWQRTLNLSFGIIGCAVAFVAYVQLNDIPRFQWLVRGMFFLIMPPIAMILGAVVGIALSLIIWRLFSSLFRGRR